MKRALFALLLAASVAAAAKAVQVRGLLRALLRLCLLPFLSWLPAVLVHVDSLRALPALVSMLPALLRVQPASH